MAGLEQQCTTGGVSTAAGLQAHGISALWYLVHRLHVPSILTHGILSHCQAHERGLVQADISCASVQARRAWRRLPCGSALHGFAPLYLVPRNPMSFALRHRLPELCLVQVAVAVADQPGGYLSDGNAASPRTRFFQGATALAQLPWAVLRARFWCDMIDGRRSRCAEVLVPGRVDAAHIERVLCFDSDTQAALARENRPVIQAHALF
ncbi:MULTISPECIES: DUF4433 domain-containing protein [Microbulbifer]|uniref:DUF4433 domain-containing protein n=1 Tax=Microbulbifer TaxID=48073 RepID=UPI000B0B3F2E|nr:MULTISPECIES: DUF4433 domain-containing protein [Microbulbifer]